jgi:hypothetical protein
MKIVKLILILVVLFLGCSASEKSEIIEVPVGKTLVVDKEGIKNISFDELFTIEHIYILDFDGFIPSFNKVISTSNYIFAIDKYKANKLYRIEKESGRTISIGGEGDGPGEYLDMVDFDVIEEENQLIVADNGNGFIKLIYHDLEGTFISERLLEGVTADYFALLKDGNLLFHTEGQCYEEQCYDFVITNQEGEILSNYSSTPAILSENWIEQHKPLSRTDDGKIIATSYSSTSMYIFESAQKVEKYDLGNEDQFITKEFLDKLDIEDDLFEIMPQSFKFYFIDNPVQIGENLIFYMEYRANLITGIYNLSTGENQLINSLLRGTFNLNATFRIIGTEDEKLILLIDPEHLLANNTSEELKTSLGIDSSELEQPILVKVSLNKSE